jgi:hypothetical protein
MSVLFVTSVDPNLIENFEAAVFNDRQKWETMGVLDCLLRGKSNYRHRSMHVRISVCVLCIACAYRLHVYFQGPLGRKTLESHFRNCSALAIEETRYIWAERTSCKVKTPLFQTFI